MMTYCNKESQLLSMPLILKEDELNHGEDKKVPAKRVNIVSVKLIKESTMMYKQRAIVIVKNF